jgi:hypothetical protein
MYRRTVLALLCCAPILTACVTTETTKTLNSASVSQSPSPTAQQLSTPPTTLIVPPGSDWNSPNKIVSALSKNGFVYRPNRHRYERLLVEAQTTNSFSVHRRRDNGVAGSGIEYRVQYSVHNRPTGTAIELQPVEATTYQEGLVGKYDVPVFTERDLTKFLQSVPFSHRFEITSPYSADATFANFERLTKSAGRPSNRPTEKLFSVPFAGSEVPVFVEVYPYRDGSKAVISAELKGTETAPGVVDIDEVRNRFEREIASIVGD